MSDPPAHADISREATRPFSRIDAHVYRVPLEKPVATSFGVMADRPALFVRLEDADGAYGFGEVWCNFPACGAEHRARLVIGELAEIVFSLKPQPPSGLFTELTELTHIRTLQTGEAGPYAQAVAGLDMAAWDLTARKAGMPLRNLLSADSTDRVPAYASGIHIRDAGETIARCRAAGHRAFKVKIGFDLQDDAARLKQLASGLGENERLFTDANQAWNLETALNFAQGMGDTPIGWLEEPLPADTPGEQWLRLALASRIPLAAGENIADMAGFDSVIGSGSIGYIQPDIAKWGGFTGCREVAKAALRAGRVYCPHYLGGGIGLAASANLLAAIGGDGLLEVDVNPNPLRDAFFEARAPGADGIFQLGANAGLGIDELPEALAGYEVLHETAAA